MSLAAILVIFLSAAYFVAAWFLIHSGRFPNLVWPIFLAVWIVMISSLIESAVPLLGIADQMTALAYSRALELTSLLLYMYALNQFKTEVKP